jgi:hypothetical protein
MDAIEGDSDVAASMRCDSCCRVCSEEDAGGVKLHEPRRRNLRFGQMVPPRAARRGGKKFIPRQAIGVVILGRCVIMSQPLRNLLGRDVVTSNGCCEVL